MHKIRKFPFYPLLLAIYSPLAMLAVNISQVKPSVVLRPVLVQVALTLILFALLRLLLKDWARAGLLTALWLLLFVTYGHIYNLLKDQPAILGEIGRHRILIPLYLGIALIGLWLVVRAKKVNPDLTRAFNWIGIALLIYPAFQIISFSVKANQSEQVASKWTFSQPPLKPANPKQLPDVYYIVLDTYTRSDALLKDFGFDNSEFISKLRGMGFYVADCAQPNYTYTQASVTATLNLDYLPALAEREKSANMEVDLWGLMKDSLVRWQLHRLGYQTVAFDTSYEWSRIKDADIFLGQAESSVSWQQLNPFERMWADSTGFTLLNDLEIKSRSATQSVINHPWADHIEKQLFLLQNLPKIADNPLPTFTYAHVLIPHVPYVFGPDGQILTDPGYFSAKNAQPVNETYLKKGYTGEIAYIDSRMETILSYILSHSQTPPIIVLMGDHGLRDDNRTKNLLAVYVPDLKNSQFYPSMTPVNVFRLIFNQYYGTTYSLLPDTTWVTDMKSVEVPKTCK